MNRQSLELAISTLKPLISDDEASENDFQNWFEQNSVAFEVLGFQQVIPHPNLLTASGELYIPDFIAQSIDSLWQIVEIKRADTKIIKDTRRRPAFYAEMEKFISQCRQYSKYFDETTHRDYFFEIFNSLIQQRPSSILIAGRDQGLDRFKVYDLLSERLPNISHLTYDDILKQLELSHTKLFGAFENMQGRSFHLFLNVDIPADRVETYIFDIGRDIEQNRMTLFLSGNGTLVLRVIDDVGIEHTISVPPGDESFTLGKTFYLNLEIGCNAKKSIITAQINENYCSEYTSSEFNMELNWPYPLVLGSNLLGKSDSFMTMSAIYSYGRTITLEEKLQLRNYFYENFYSNKIKNQPSPGIEFKGRKFLYTDGHPNFSNGVSVIQKSMNLIQSDPEKKPVLRTEFS